MYVCMYVPINQTNTYMLISLNTDDINYANKTLSICMYVCYGYRCDVIAMGVINAAQNIGMKKPIIIRLKGTNVEEAKKLIEVGAHTYTYIHSYMRAYLLNN